MNRVTAITPQENGKNLSGDKEQIRCYKFIAPNPKFKAGESCPRRYAEPITIRVWMSRSANASLVYASIWARSRDGETRTAGHGVAGGYGYCKISAAIDSAFSDAGIAMDAGFGGCGMSCVEIAIEALARKLGWKTGQIVSL